MALKVAINGFGRIGRMAFRAGLSNKDIEFVAINDLTDSATLAHLLKYDSSQGTLDDDISSTEHSLIINGKDIRIYKEKDPSKIPWGDEGQGERLGPSGVRCQEGDHIRPGKGT